MLAIRVATGWLPPPTPFREEDESVRGVLAVVAGLAAGAGFRMPRIPQGKPRHYYKHLSKAERKGKSYAELQAMKSAAPEGGEESDG